MTDVDKVRMLCQDSPVPGSLAVDLDGTSALLQLDKYPVLESSVIITGSVGVVQPTFTVDSRVGLVTFGSLPIADTVAARYKLVILLNADLQALLDLNAGSSDPVRLAAADALDMIASNQSLVLKKIKLLDLTTDGPAVAEALRKHAETLRALVFDPKYDEATFDIAEEVYDVPSWNEKVVKDWEREEF